MRSEKTVTFFPHSSNPSKYKIITKFLFSLFITLLILFPREGFARLNGMVSLQYGLSSQERYNTTIDRERMTQKYHLGYASYLYSPRLLSYSLDGDYSIVDSKTQSNYSEQSNRSNMTGYRASGQFIQGSFMPFSISLYKSSAPNWNYSDGEETQYTLTETDSANLGGVIRLRYFDIEYGASETESTSENIRFELQRDHKERYVSVVKRVDNIYFETKYKHKEEYSKTVSFDGLSDNEYENIYSNLDTRLRWKTSPTLSVNTSAYIFNSETYDFTNIYGNVNLGWSPTKNFSASTGISTNNYSGKNTTSSSTSINENMRYRYSKHLNFSQGFSLMQTASDQSNTTAGNLNIGASYQNMIADTYKYSLSANLASNMTDYVHKESNQTNTSTVSQTYGANGTIARSFPTFNTKLRSSLAYSSTNVRGESEGERLSFSTGLSSSFTKALNYALSVGYSAVETTYAGAESMNFTNYSASQSLRHSTRLTYSTSIANSLGMNYSRAVEADLDIINYYASHSLQTHLYRSLRMNYLLRADKSSVSSFVNYNANVNLSFYIGQIAGKVTATYGYLDDEKIENDITNKSINFSLSRSF